MSDLPAGDPFESGPAFTLAASELSSLWAWLMAGLSLVALGVAVIGDLFPPVLGLDLLALWPFPALAAVVLLIVRITRAKGVLRIVAPLILVTWLILGVGWWSVGTPPPPSQAANVDGPPQVPSEVALGIELDGELTIVPGTGHVYSVALGRRGGAVGAPDVLEAREDDVMAMTIQERTDSGWYRSSGWDVRLHPAALWRITVTADTVDLDFSDIPLGQLDLRADGEVALGEPSGLVIVDLQGAITVAVPTGVPVTVVGDAAVPEGWEQTENGWASPTEGDGYLITTGGGPGIRVVHR